MQIVAGNGVMTDGVKGPSLRLHMTLPNANDPAELVVNGSSDSCFASLSQARPSTSISPSQNPAQHTDKRALDNKLMERRTQRAPSAPAYVKLLEPPPKVRTEEQLVTLRGTMAPPSACVSPCVAAKFAAPEAALPEIIITSPGKNALSCSRSEPALRSHHQAMSSAAMSNRSPDSSFTAAPIGRTPAPSKSRPQRSAGHLYGSQFGDGLNPLQRRRAMLVASQTPPYMLPSTRAHSHAHLYSHAQPQAQPKKQTLAQTQVKVPAQQTAGAPPHNQPHSPPQRRAQTANASLRSHMGQRPNLGPPGSPRRPQLAKMIITKEPRVPLMRSADAHGSMTLQTYWAQSDLGAQFQQPRVEDKMRSDERPGSVCGFSYGDVRPPSPRKRETHTPSSAARAQSPQSRNYLRIGDRTGAPSSAPLALWRLESDELHEYGDDDSTLTFDFIRGSFSAAA